MNADVPSPAISHRPPTERQLEVLRFIARHMARLGYPPTQREICDGIGAVSTNAAAAHLAALEHKGLVAHTPMVARGIVLTAAGKALIEGGS